MSSERSLVPSKLQTSMAVTGAALASAQGPAAAVLPVCTPRNSSSITPQQR